MEDKCPRCGAERLDDYEKMANYACETVAEDIGGEVYIIHSGRPCAMRQRDALQAIVDRLPTTEDGVPFQHGMTVWAYWSPGEGFKKVPIEFTLRGWEWWSEDLGIAASLKAVDGQRVDGMIVEKRYQPFVNQCPIYSTRALAEAAVKGE